MTVPWQRQGPRICYDGGGGEGNGGENDNDSTAGQPGHPGAAGPAGDQGAAASGTSGTGGMGPGNGLSGSVSKSQAAEMAKDPDLAARLSAPATPENPNPEQSGFSVSRRGEETFGSFRDHEAVVSARQERETDESQFTDSFSQKVLGSILSSIVPGLKVTVGTKVNTPNALTAQTDFSVNRAIADTLGMAAMGFLGSKIATPVAKAVYGATNSVPGAVLGGYAANLGVGYGLNSAISSAVSAANPSDTSVRGEVSTPSVGGFGSQVANGSQDSPGTGGLAGSEGGSTGNLEAGARSFGDTVQVQAASDVVMSPRQAETQGQTRSVTPMNQQGQVTYRTGTSGSFGSRIISANEAASRDRSQGLRSTSRMSI